MLGFLWRLIVGKFQSCNHEWETIKAVLLQSVDTNYPHGMKVYLRCKKCGIYKSQHMKD